MTVDEQNEFDGLTTFCNTTPSKPLTLEDLEEAITLMEKAKGNGDLSCRKVLRNQQCWENMLICEPDRTSQRFNDILMHMRFGLSFDDYSKNIGLILSPCHNPQRFRYLRRQLYKISMRLTDGKRVR